MTESLIASLADSARSAQLAYEELAEAAEAVSSAFGSEMNWTGTDDLLRRLDAALFAVRGGDIARMHPRVVAALGSSFIEAVKVYRSVYGVGLKEAKEAVERYRDRQVSS